MIAFLAFGALVLGGILFLTASARIFAHDDGSNGVMVQCASGFILVVAATTIGVIAL